MELRSPSKGSKSFATEYLLGISGNTLIARSHGNILWESMIPLSEQYFQAKNLPHMDQYSQTIYNSFFGNSIHSILK